MKQATLAELRAFAAVAEHRSFRRAADLLGITRSTLSHGMRGLEETLGTRLLHRTTRSVSLTEAGERLLLRVGPLVGELDAVLSDVAGAEGQPLGALRISGGESAIRLLLRTVVPAFIARYPGIELDLVADGRMVDIVEQGFDAGVRLGEAVPRDMVAIRLSDEIRFLAVASPSYLKTIPAPRHPDQLMQHRCIRQRLPSGKRYRWEFSKGRQDMAIDVPGPLTLDNNQLMVEAAADGLGIAFVPEHYARGALDAGDLVTVLLDWCPSIPGLFLYFPRVRHMPTNLRFFIDLIKQSDLTLPTDSRNATPTP